MKRVGKSVSSSNNITVITGLPRSGKSTLLQTKIIPDYLKRGKTVLVVDVNREYKAARNLYVYDITDYSKAAEETDALIGFLIEHPRICDVIVFDESNVLFPKTNLLPNAKRLVNTNRHLGIDIIAVARRPVDINITISELANKRYVFRATGYNDIQRLNNLKIGLGDRAYALGQHDYIGVDNDSAETLHKGGK